MLSDRTMRSASAETEPAENLVLEAVSNVVVGHLGDKAESPSPECPPVLIQVDGPGKSLFLQRLGVKLDPVLARPHARKGARAAAEDGQPPAGAGRAGNPNWTVITFDAWQYQRLSPPWWWLMSAIDKQIKARSRAVSRWRRVRYRMLVAWERMRCLAPDLALVLAGVAVFVVGWEAQGKALLHLFKWLVTAGGGLLAITAFLSTLRNAVARHLLAQSPRGTTALLRTTDPMEELLRRYDFLTRSAGTPIAVLIDNLDRCHAEYIVEMLEGIQTLLRHRPHSRRRRRPSAPDRPLVVFVVAADRSWLCDSYVRVYAEFDSGAREPGRPFGLVFLDKIFEFMLRLPTIPAGVSVAARTDQTRVRPGNPFDGLEQELDVRRELRELERAVAAEHETTNLPPAVPRLRADAVERLGDIHRASLHAEGDRRFDTNGQLEQLLADMDPGPAIRRALETAYCVGRATQLLAGHAVDTDSDAIYRLGLWTLIELKWPDLASHLTRSPHDLEHIAKEAVPETIAPELRLVLDDPVARRLTHRVLEGRLQAQDIARFTTPLPTPSAASQTKGELHPRQSSHRTRLRHPDLGAGSIGCSTALERRGGEVARA